MMAEITATAVKSLRDRTGAGMMDCKKALEEAGGDEERAIDLLRQRGAAKAAKRAAREVSEGAIQIASGDGAAAMVEVLSETDFVSRSDPFGAFAKRAAETVLGLDLPDGEIVGGERVLAAAGGEDLESGLDELRVKVGENVQLSRAVRFEVGGGSSVGSYLHFGNRIGVVVEVTGSGTGAGEAANDVAMHAAATNPAGVSPDDIPDEVIERERAVLVEQARAEGKPPQIAEKIVEGRMRKFFEENALLWQAFVKDPDKTISERLAESGDDLTVRRFARFEVGA